MNTHEFSKCPGHQDGEAGHLHGIEMLHGSAAQYQQHAGKPGTILPCRCWHTDAVSCFGNIVVWQSAREMAIGAHSLIISRNPTLAVHDAGHIRVMFDICFLC